MKRFFAGFEKRAFTGTAFGAGVGAGGAYATAKKEMEVSKLREATIERSPSLTAFIKKLQPGDVIYSGVAGGIMPSDSVAKKFGFRAIPLVSGDLKYHSMVYTGRGKVIDAARRRDLGEGNRTPDIAEIPLQKKLRSLKRNEYTLTAYRSIGDDRDDRRRAVERARSLIGGRYPDDLEITGKALKVLVGIPGRKGAITKDEPLVCQDTAIKAYPDKFPKRHLTVSEMQYNPNFTPVARAGSHTYSPEEQILAQNTYPLLKGLRAGLKGAAVGAIADIIGKRVKNKRRQS